jgi:hypothetical protein
MARKIKLGKRYRDDVTGFEGVATSRTEYIYGCRRIGLEFLHDGEVKTHSFDEPGLTEIGDKPVVSPTAEERRTGGTRPTTGRLDR